MRITLKLKSLRGKTAIPTEPIPRELLPVFAGLANSITVSLDRAHVLRAWADHQGLTLLQLKEDQS